MPAQEQSMAVNIPPNAPPHVYAAAAEQCLEWGRPDGALKVSELGLSRHPSYYGLRLFRAEALLMHKRIEQAEEDLRAVLVAEPQHPRAVKILAHILLEQHRYKEAIPILERAEFILMDDPDIPKWLAEAEKGLEEQAREPVTPRSFIYTEAFSEGLKEFVAVPGVLAVSARDFAEERLAGRQADAFRLPMERLASLEQRVDGIMGDAGFGKLVDVCMQESETTWTARRGVEATLRVVSEAHLREGLVTWHCRKLLGEVAE